MVIEETPYIHLEEGWGGGGGGGGGRGGGEGGGRMVNTRAGTINRLINRFGNIKTDYWKQNLISINRKNL